MRRAASAAALLTVLIACALAPSPARAALKLCNRTSYIVYAATGIDNGRSIATTGWARIVPGSCALAIKTGLGALAYYVYARTSQAHDGPAHAWGGATLLCVRDTDFSLDVPALATRCPSDDSYEMPFSRIDPKGRTDWTTTFTQVPPLASAEAARQAGLMRLLGDAGYRIGRQGDAAHALDKFRIRMKMPAAASPAALFDALETEALKIAAPAGYSVCNDTDAPVWAALGHHDGKVWHSRGWWKVMPGACARTLTAALAADRIYLRVERKGGAPLVTGNETFCVTSIAFDIERREQCKARGLTPAGFAVTDTRGQSGYAAHVSDDGLLPPLRVEP